MYADDTNAFHSDKCIKSLTHVMQEEMNEVIKWLNANKLYYLYNYLYIYL
jgi:hypothetical protein